jgi:hypothetical protein
MCRVPCFVWWHSGRDVPLDQEIDMMLKLLRHFRIAAVLPREQTEQPTKPGADSRHN